MGKRVKTEKRALDKDRGGRGGKRGPYHPVSILIDTMLMTANSPASSKYPNWRCLNFSLFMIERLRV